MAQWARICEFEIAGVTRARLSWRILDQNLVGTYHAAKTLGPGGHSMPCRTGVLLLNAGPTPRAGNSDLSVHISDRLALHGTPVFRFDLPGLGDSSGPRPSKISAFWREVLGGRNNEFTLELVREMRRQFGIARAIVGGLCAAVVPTLHAASRANSEIAGAILLEPDFRNVAEAAPRSLGTGIDATRNQVSKKRLQRILSYREWLYILTGESRIAPVMRPLHPLLLRALERTVGHCLLQDTNIPLVMQWRNCVERGMHSLVVVSEGHLSDRYVTRILDHWLPQNGPGANCLVRIPETNHILTSGNARELVVAAVEHWIRARFGVRPTTTAVSAD